MFAEFNLFKRDPRRLQPLVDFIIQRAHDADLNGGSAFALNKSLTFMHSLMRCMSWRFDAWSEQLSSEYFDALGNDYAEVRLVFSLPLLKTRLMILISQSRSATSSRSACIVSRRSE